MNRIPRPDAAGLLRALREWPGWFVLAVGACLCVLGWYGVSGERVTARQVPYLASATAPGVALIVAGAVLVAARWRAGREQTADPRLERLYALLLTETAAGTPAAGTPAAGPPAAGPPLALPDGTLYHRPDCPLVAGKPGAEPAGPQTVRDRGLTPCPVCDPGPP